MFSKVRIILLLLLFAGIMTTACGADGEDTDDTSLPQTQTDIQFSWLYTVEFAGFYAAQDHGYYPEENLDVRLDEGGFDENGEYIDPVQRVITGQADFGVFSADGLILARAEGHPVVAVATIYQRSPTVLVTLAENNIRTPQDLIGKTIAVNFGSDDTIFYALLTSQGIDRDAVTVVAADPSMEPLMNGEVDAQMGFITNEPVTLRQQGHDVNLVIPSEYGIEVYSNVIFTTEDMIANQPDLVERFVRATLRGYEEAMADPEHAAQLAVEYNAELNVENELASMRASLPLLRPAGRHLGEMTTDVWETTHQILLEQGSLNEPIDIDTVYTLAFLAKSD